MARRYLLLGLITTVCLGCQPPQATQDAPAKSGGAAGMPAALEQSLAGGDAAPASERVKAEAGVAQRGRSLDNETGVGAVIVEPARQLFRFQEKAVFDIQIPQALQLFQATEGRLPNSHDEFMAKIIKANNIALPELPAGQKYVFDATTGELMVEKPAG